MIIWLLFVLFASALCCMEQPQPPTIEAINPEVIITLLPAEIQTHILCFYFKDFITKAHNLNELDKAYDEIIYATSHYKHLGKLLSTTALKKEYQNKKNEILIKMYPTLKKMLKIRRIPFNVYVQHGINAKNEKGETLMHLASGNGNKQAVELLLNNKANINPTANSYFLTPLDYAEQGQHQEIVALLHEYGATNGEFIRSTIQTVHELKIFKYHNYEIDDLAEMVKFCFKTGAISSEQKADFLQTISDKENQKS